MKKVIICKTTDKYVDYESVGRVAMPVDYAEVSDDDYLLLESYVNSIYDRVLLTIEPPERIVDFIELARERLKKQQELQKRQEEKRKKADKDRLLKQKERKLKKAIELLRKEGIAVEESQ